MSPFIEFEQKLPPILGVCIECAGRNQQLYPIRDAITALQLTHYWWRQASEKMVSYTADSAVLVTEEGKNQIHQPNTPTLITTSAQLDYVRSGLASLSDSVFDYINATPLPEIVKHSLLKGYDNVTEALFHIQTATNYNEQLNNYNRKPKPGA